MAARAAQAGQIVVGPLSEFGIVVAQGIRQIEGRVPEILEEEENGLCGMAPAGAVRATSEHCRAVGPAGAQLDAQVHAWHREQVDSRRLAGIPGKPGPLTASATDGGGRQRPSGCCTMARQLAAMAWALVPRQSVLGRPRPPAGASSEARTSEPRSHRTCCRARCSARCCAAAGRMLPGPAEGVGRRNWSIGATPMWLAAGARATANRRRLAALGAAWRPGNGRINPATRSGQARAMVGWTRGSAPAAQINATLSPPIA